MTDQEIFSKVSTLMEQLDRNQELQDLSERNGLDVKNSIRLTQQNKDNVAVSVVSLLLAKNENDKRYRELNYTGLQKRKLKAEIINSYKDRASQLIKQYRDTKS